MNIPILGKPQIIGTIPIISFVCSCAKSVIMVRDGEKVKCNICNKIWLVVVSANVKIEEVLIDIASNMALTS